MPWFRYTARDAEGRRKTGELDADGAGQARSELEQTGLIVEQLEVSDAVEVEEWNSNLSDRDVVEFARQVAALNQAGLPLPGALRALSEELERGPLKRVLSGVSDRLEAGQSLAEAVDAHSESFPPHLRGLVLAGLKGGRLGEVLEQFTRYYHVGSELKRRLWLSLAYPLLLIGVDIVLFFFVARVIVNDFKRIFADFGVALPEVTKAVIQVADALSRIGIWVPICLLLGIVFLVLVEVTRGPRAQTRRLVDYIPVIGPLWRWIALVEFSHLLGLLLESEVPLPMALQLTGDGMSRGDYVSACQAMRRDVESGRSLADAIEQRPQFPAGLPRILRWAEGHETLPGALHMAGDLYESRARAQATFAGVAFSVMAFVLVIWGLGIMVVALFSPLFRIIGAIL